MSPRGEAEKLEDCDYVTSGSGTAIPYILRELRSMNYRARLIDATDSVSSFKGFYVNLVNWEVLDGILFTNLSILWNKSTPIVELVKDLLHQYHLSEAEQIINACVTTKIHIEGYPDKSFSETKRGNVDYARIYEWKAEGEHLVSRSDWIPLIGE